MKATRLSSLSHIVVLAIFSLIILSVPARLQAQGPTVKVLLFYSKTCPHCHAVIEQVLPPLQEKYGRKLEVRQLEIGDPQNYGFLLKLEEAYKVPPDRVGVPEMFIGTDYLIGSIEINEKLDALIEQYLVQGGVDYPGVTSSAEVSFTPTASATASPAPQIVVATPSAASPVTTTQVTDSITVAGSSDAAEATTATPLAPAIHLAYFYQVGCQECDRVQLDLKYLQDRYPQLAVTSFDNHEQAALLEQLGAKAGVPENRRLIAPAVFVGQEALVAEEVHASSLENLIESHLTDGAPPYWENATKDDSQAAGSILTRFRNFGPLTIAAAGLVDGLNPCAFATVVFFVSYLALAGRRGKTILAVGAAFTLGVFLTYLGVGFGFLKAVAAMPFIREAGPWLYGVTALLCVALAAFSFQDYRRVRQGKVEEMRLKLPLFLRKRVNQVIREGAGLNAFIPIAFVTGGIISLIELACTGQIYLPVIMFVLGVPEMRAGALSYLLLYNVMFIVPLVVVFLAAYWGTTSERMGILLSRRLAQVKLATAALFLLMGLWLALTVLA